MKKLIIVLVALGLFSCQVSCQGNKKDATTVGIAPNVQDGAKIVVYNMMKGGSPIPIDTAIVQKEKFTLQIPTTGEQTLNSLTLEGTRGNLLFIHADEPIKFTLYKDSLRASKIEGGEHNALMNDYFSQMKKFGTEISNLQTQYGAAALEKDSTKLKEIISQRDTLIQNNADYQISMIKESPHSLVSLLILSDLMRMKQLSTSEIKKHFQSFPETLQSTAIGQQIEKTIETAAATAVGVKAPEFSGPTPDGKTLALKDVLGKVTLIDFWASWCNPCRAENPNLVKVYKKYHDQGFNIIQVSLDKTKEKWVTAIKDDQLDWLHVSNLKFWQDPIARKYNIRSIPAAFLLDENGVIIARDLRGDDLEKKVAEALQK